MADDVNRRCAANNGDESELRTLEQTINLKIQEKVAIGSGLRNKKATMLFYHSFVTHNLRHGTTECKPE
jgi:hypothetical protein